MQDIQKQIQEQLESQKKVFEQLWQNTHQSLSQSVASQLQVANEQLERAVSGGQISQELADDLKALHAQQLQTLQDNFSLNSSYTSKVLEQIQKKPENTVSSLLSLMNEYMQEVGSKGVKNYQLNVKMAHDINTSAIQNVQKFFESYNSSLPTPSSKAKDKKSK